MPATIIIHTHSIHQEILCVGRAGGIEPAIGGQPTLPPAPQSQLQVTKKMPPAPEAELINAGWTEGWTKGEKTSVNWVACHRCIPALSLISPREVNRDPGEGLSTALECELWAVACQLKACVCVCVCLHALFFLLLPLNSWSTSHLDGGQSAH